MTDRESSSQRLEEAAGEARYAKLYREEMPYVWNFLRRLGVKTDGDIEDLTQEVFIRAFQGWNKFDASRPLRPWLLGIAFRVASDFLRLARHRVEQSGDAAEASHGARSPEDLVAAAQDRALVERAIQSLPMERRSVLVLHDLQGCAAPEIAEALEIPLNTVYSRLRVARGEVATAIKAVRRGDP